MSTSYETALLEVRNEAPREAMGDALRRMVHGAGSAAPVVKAFCRAALGPGRLSLQEFEHLRLFDRERYGDADLRSFVGLAASRKIWWTTNFKVALWSLMENKLAADAVLEAYGFRTIPKLAVFRLGCGMASAATLVETSALAEFLRTPAHFPLFGKPLEGAQSLGSVSFEAYSPQADALIAADGRRVSVAAFAGEIAAQYGAGGYLFQPRVTPAAAVREVCGDRLATVRVLTILRNGEPKILRTCWKLPAGLNAADNYWRRGNILAQVDPVTGTIGRAMTGRGAELTDVLRHPDTGAELVGRVVPNWAAVTGAALQAARAMNDFGLIGWDIAPVEGGALIVEMNHTPDLFLPQLADRRGILDAEFAAFVAERRVMRRAFLRMVKRFHRRS